MATRREMRVGGLLAGTGGWWRGMGRGGESVVGGLVGGAGGLVRGMDGLVGKGSQPSTKVNFEVPAGACDCHVHVFGDPARYPFFAGRTYTPDTATVQELRALH